MNSAAPAARQVVAEARRSFSRAGLAGLPEEGGEVAHRIQHRCNGRQPFVAAGEMRPHARPRRREVRAGCPAR